MEDSRISENLEMKKKLLLHVCCAPCASGCLGMLEEAGRQFTLFFSNSNIWSREEYEKRLRSVEKLASLCHLDLQVDPYDHASWLDSISMPENAPDFPEGGARCRLCFEWSLARTAEAALKEGMNFCTTLTVSPHKSSRIIFEAGARFPGFEPWDFKKKDGFKKSVELSRRYGLYRQNFCGCEFSLSRILKPFSS